MSGLWLLALLPVAALALEGAEGPKVPTGGPYGAAVLAAARASLGIRETAPNSGPEIDAWLQELGITPPAEWCGAAVSHWLKEAAKTTGRPMVVPGAGRAKAILEQFSKRGRALPADAARGALLPAGTVLVWDRSTPPGTGPQGHTGIVEADKGASWVTIEGNTAGADVRRVTREKSDPRLLGAGLVDAAPSLTPEPWTPPPVGPAGQPAPLVRRVLVAGDSLAQGLAPPLATLLAQVHGFGVSGSTITAWSSASSSVAAPLFGAVRPLDVVLLSLGTNDIAAHVSAEQVRAHVRALVQQLEARGAVIGWIGPPALPSSLGTGFGVRAVLAQECSALGVPLLDSEAIPLERAPDGVHATPQGYATWAAAVAAWVKVSGLA